MLLKYENDAQEAVESLLIIGEADSTLKVNDKSELKFDDSKWIKRTFSYTVYTACKLLSISAQNRYDESSENSIKLGLLKLSESADPVSQTNTPPNLSIQSRSQLFRIEGQTYLTLTLNWNEQPNWHFNVFVDSNRYIEGNKETKWSSNFKYIGSTQIPSFALCLKLNDQVWLDPTLGSSDPSLAFHVMIEPVREISESHFVPILDETKLGERNCSSHNVVLVKEPRVKQNRDLTKNASFFDKVVDDFESFL